MTWKEAAENRKRCFEYLSECKHSTPENVEANKLAVEALERMIPEQMIDPSVGTTKEYETVVISGKCPNCGVLFCEEYGGDVPEIAFCRRCGKALTV